MENNDQNYTALWLQFKNGNRDAFAELYHSHIKSLIAYGSKLCQDEELLKDNIQDLFVELWNGRENLADAGCVTFYLFKALRYKLIRAEKMRQAHNTVSQNIFFSSNAHSSFDAPVESVIIDKEMLDSQINMLGKAVAALTKRQQEAVQLRFYQGFTNEQIAELMGMNYQSVSNLMYTALCRIKKNLKAPVFTTALGAAFHLFF
jgi:RNA polymerase sigma-70 factor (ECF subfamily)